MISIALPVYNGEKYIAECLDSLLAQTYEDFEIILIDDCSTDDTAQIVAGYDDTRIRYYKNEKNLGIVHTLNKAFGLCRGEYIARMDADDIAMPQRLEKQLELMERNPELGIVSVWFQMFGDVDCSVHYAVEPKEIACRLLFSLQLLHPGWLMRRRLVDEGLAYREEYRYAEDWDFLVRAARTVGLGNVPRELMRYRINPGQLSNVYNAPQQAAANRVARDQLEYLGMELTDEQFALYRRAFGRREELLSGQEMDKLLQILRTMEQANGQKRVYDPAMLHKVIREEVYWLCKYNLAKGCRSGLKLLGSGYYMGLKLGIAGRCKLWTRLAQTAIFGK